MENNIELKLLYWVKWMLDQAEFKDLREEKSFIGNYPLIYERLEFELKKHNMENTDNHMSDKTGKYSFPYITPAELLLYGDKNGSR